MQIEGLVFAGVASPDALALAGLFRDVLGLEPAPGDGYHAFELADGSSLAVVPKDWISPPSDTILGFLVDDVVEATAELAARGVETEGELAANERFRYQHFRAPDGRVFELLDRRV